MTRGTIHAAKPGLTGDHRTDGLRCPCDPAVLADINEPGRAVVVHRAMTAASTFQKTMGDAATGAPLARGTHTYKDGGPTQ